MKTTKEETLSRQVIAPLIHMGGTSGEELLGNLEEAGRRLGEAMTALRALAPNGRDYYPLAPEALRWALRDHDARIAKLAEVLEDVTKIHEEVHEQAEARKKR